MKRYFACILALILLIPCLAVPASATGAYDENISENIELIGSDLYSWFEQWYAYFLEPTETVNDVSGAEALVTPFKYDLIQAQMFVWSWIGSVFDDIKSHTSSIKNSVSGIYYNVNMYFEVWHNYFQGIAYNIQQLLKGDTTKPDDLDEDLAPLETQVDDWVEEMETAPTIDQEGIDSIFMEIIDHDEVDPLYTSYFGYLFGTDLFFLLLFYSFVFGILGYVLYGKR